MQNQMDRILSFASGQNHKIEKSSETITGRQIHIVITSTIPSGFEDSWKKVFTSIYDVTERVLLDQEKKAHG
jgi:hypothetical protein